MPLEVRTNKHERTRDTVHNDRRIVMAMIQLTQGKTAIVDDEHVHLVSGYKWCYGSRGYAVRKVRSTTMHEFMHIVLWEAVNGPVPQGREIDHKNRNGVDNRMENLRVVTRSENLRNRDMKRNGEASSKYPGVTWNKQSKKWMANIRVNGRQTYIGLFDDEEEAAMAYQSVVDSLSQ